MIIGVIVRVIDDFVKFLLGFLYYPNHYEYIIAIT